MSRCQIVCGDNPSGPSAVNSSSLLTKSCQPEDMSAAHNDVRASQAPSLAADDLSRIGDAEREAACEELTEHFVLGRLTQEELDVRLSLATRAQTNGDLAVVISDLPRSPEWDDKPPSVTRQVDRSSKSMAVALVVAIVSGLGLVGLLIHSAMELSASGTIPNGMALTRVFLAALLALTSGVASTMVATHQTHRWRRKIEDELRHSTEPT